MTKSHNKKLKLKKMSVKSTDRIRRVVVKINYLFYRHTSNEYGKAIVKWLCVDALHQKAV